MKNNEEKDHIDELLEEIEEAESLAEENSETETLKKELEETKNKMLKQAADLDNFRKRIVKETDEKIKYANQSLISKFLPVMDNFDLSLAHTDGVDLETVFEGIRLNRKVMFDIMEKSGVAKIPAEIGDTFDPQIHEAIAICNNPDMPDNTIAVVIQSGYTLEGRVIRSPKVQVNKLS